MNLGKIYENVKKILLLLTVVYYPPLIFYVIPLFSASFDK